MAIPVAETNAGQILGAGVAIPDANLLILQDVGIGAAADEP